MKTNKLKLILTLALATMLNSAAADETGVDVSLITAKLDKQIEQRLTETLQRDIQSSSVSKSASDIEQVNPMVTIEIILGSDCLCAVHTDSWITDFSIL